MKCLFGNQRICASLSSVLMLVNFILTQCVCQCWLVFILEVSSVVTANASLHTKTNPTLLNTWSFLFVDELDQFVELREMLPLVDKKDYCFDVEGVCNHRKTVFEAMGYFDHYCSQQRNWLSSSDAENEREEQNVASWDALGLHTTKRIPKYWDVGVLVVVSLQSWYISPK